MANKIELLDCTLRDGAYVVDAKFGTAAVRGMIRKMQDAGVEIIECGWLKNEPHEQGTTYFHVPDDLGQYLTGKSKRSLYVAMMDWDRYDLEHLPVYDGNTIDAVRIVFPYGKHKEGISVGKAVKEKGYRIFFQAANTLAYANEDLAELAQTVNEVHPDCLSVVDTFGAMYDTDLERIVSVLDGHLDQDIKIGFHSHNNQQLSFSLTMRFIQLLEQTGRGIVVDASLCGMGRGAGNANTELVANYLNRKKQGGYQMNVILDAIDTYMGYFQENYCWGYSIPYFIAGMYCCHVNNIVYLLKNHRTNAVDMKNIIESLMPEERRRYDYEVLEQKYLENQNRTVDDSRAMKELGRILKNRDVLLIAPGKSADTEQDRIRQYIAENRPVVIGVNAVNPHYVYDYLFFINSIRYHYAQDVYTEQWKQTKKIHLSSIKTKADQGETIINFYRVIKRGWEHFDNAVIDCLRLLDQLDIEQVSIAGFDGFKHKYNESYADALLPTLNPDGQWDKLNEEILDMFQDFQTTRGHRWKIQFLTDSIFEGGHTPLCKAGDQK